MSNVLIEKVNNKLWNTLARNHHNNNLFFTPSFCDTFNDIDKFIIKTGDQIWGLATLPKPNKDKIGILSEQIIYSGIYLFEDIEKKLPLVKFNEINFKASTNLAKYIVKNYKQIKFRTTYQRADLRPYLWEGFDNKNIEVNILPKYTSVKNIEAPLDGSYLDSSLFKTIIYEKRRKIMKGIENKAKFLPNINKEEFIQNYIYMMQSYGEEVSDKKIE